MSRRPPPLPGALLAVAVCLASGCVYNQDVRGTPVAIEALPRLERGQTTERELLVALGPPQRLGWVGEGETRYLYTFSVEHLRQLYLTYQGFRVFQGSMTDRTSREAFFDFDGRGRLVSWGIVVEAADEE